MSPRWGHKRETSGHLHPWKTSGSARDFLKKLEKMQRRTATEMAFMGTLKVSASSHQHRLSIFFPETAGQSSRKVSNLFRHARRIMQVFDSGSAGEAALQLSAAFRQHVHVAWNLLAKADT
jgi:hypothetical protein